MNVIEELFMCGFTGGNGRFPASVKHRGEDAINDEPTCQY